MNGEMSYKQGKYLNLLDRFADSGFKICEVTFTKEDKEKTNDKAIFNGISSAINRYNKWHINVVRRDNKFYLVNTVLNK